MARLQMSWVLGCLLACASEVDGKPADGAVALDAPPAATGSAAAPGVGLPHGGAAATTPAVGRPHGGPSAAAPGVGRPQVGPSAGPSGQREEGTKPAPSGPGAAASHHSVNDAGNVEPVLAARAFGAPSYPGAAVQTLEGEIGVEGRPTSISIFETSDPPEVVIAFFRAGFASLPWDQIERPVEGGILLGVLDNRGGRRLAIEATKRKGATQVTWGWSAPSVEETDLPPIALPREIVWLGRVKDTLGATTHSLQTGFSPRSVKEVEGILASSLEGTGWSAVAPALWQQGGRQVRVSVEPEGRGSRVSLQLKEESRQ